ncbi:EAL domain-containing protein [Sulfurimonas sp.]|nr:EAL domain-containing protein [Sulfurimonas sp.]
MRHFIPISIKLSLYNALFIIISTISITLVAENYVIDVVEKHNHAEQVLESKNVVDRDKSMLVVISMGIAFFGIMLSLLIINKLVSSPVRKLIKGINIIANGDYNHNIKINKTDEFGIISDSFNDMAHQISKRERDLDDLVHQDILTKIPNRVLFNQRLEEAISRAGRIDKKIAVFFIDLDDFKTINDTMGHDAGDELLIQVSTNLVNIMRKNDMLARIGGDEFNVLVEDLDSIVVAQDIAKKLIEQITIPINIDGNIINITGSVGVSIYPVDAKDSTSLLKNADLAMYDAKSFGKNNYKFFSHELSLTLRKRSTMLKELKQALHKNELQLYYQPKFSLKDGSIKSAEALIRWKSKTLGFIPPDDFIGLSEDSGEIVEIGAWVILQAAKDFASWRDNGLNVKQVSVNVSNVQFEKGDIVPLLSQAIKDNNIPPSALEVEITESYAQKDGDNAIVTLNKIRELGVDLAMDDFGTGYSSMSYLKKLPLTRLKIDKSFIDDIPHDNDDVEITKIIVALAKVMDLSITAEGIETIEQMNFLEKLGCDEGQGYICSKPLPNDQFITALKNGMNCQAPSQ